MAAQNPSPSLDEELADLTERMEKILHEELPAQARLITTANDPGIRDGLIQVVAELDEVQKAIGLKTYSLLRGVPRVNVSPVLAALGAKEEDVRASGVHEPDFVGERTPAVGAAEAAPPIVKCTSCSRTENIEACFECSKLFCQKHLHTSQHPCGDLL